MSTFFSIVQIVYTENACLNTEAHLAKTANALQWSFRKTGTMGTLASQAESGVWGCFCGCQGYHFLKS